MSASPSVERTTLVDVALATGTALLVASDHGWLFRWLAAFLAVFAFLVVLATWVFASLERGEAPSSRA